MSKELNKKLSDSITEREIDYDLVDELLKEGADPLGCYNDYNDTPIGNLFCMGGEDWGEETNGTLSDRFPKLINIFIKNGFDCSRFQRDTDRRYNRELWCLTFSISQGAYETLKILIEHGLPIPAMEDFISHFYTDSEMCDGSDMTPDYEEYLIWAFRMIMLCASYPHILKNSEYLRECVELDSTNKENRYDLTRFRQYEDFEYFFDISTLNNYPYGMRNATVRIIEKKTENEVWTMKI